MSAAHLRCVTDADFEEVGEQRRGDRRQGDRRAARARLDPRFVVTLINQLAGPKALGTGRYGGEPKRPRAGVAFDLKA